jgi:hypothetical protein
MGDNDNDQRRHLAKDGLFPLSSQDLLRQVPAARGSSSDARADIRPTSMFYISLPCAASSILIFLTAT